MEDERGSNVFNHSTPLTCRITSVYMSTQHARYSTGVPTFDFRYKFSEQSNLRINYRGTIAQPTMSQLLSIVDNTDPQNISIGNPGLKPAFTNNFRLFYNTYKQSHAQALMTFANFSTTRNDIGNSVTYDAITGARRYSLSM